jgi:DNA (cytosine-5)-methyltransferase 1
MLNTDLDYGIRGSNTPTYIRGLPIRTFINCCLKHNDMSNFTVLELFAGAGGMALGFEMAGLETEALIEINKDACATLKKNRPQWNVIHQDVSEIDFSKYNADVVAGGFPCQSFSYAGKGLGFEDTRGTLFFEFARAVKEIQPKIFVGENVEGLKNHDNGRTLQTMTKVLTDLGYHLQMKVLNGIDYSVAQKRKRVFLIGTLPGYHFTYPAPHKEKVVLRDALKDVPESKGTKYSQRRYDVMKLVPPGGCWVDLPLDIQKEFMGASFFSGGGRRGMARRISWDEACLTLTTSPSQKQTERCHPEETRPFTIREYARIQSFPDEWQFEGSVSSSYKQIGNAVAVNVAKAVGEQIIHYLQNPNNDTKMIHTKETLVTVPIVQQTSLKQYTEEG